MGCCFPAIEPATHCHTLMRQALSGRKVQFLPRDLSANVGGSFLPGRKTLPKSTETAEALARPFDPNEIKWKPQAVKQNRCLAIAYIDARLVQDRLDEAVGVENWSDSYDVLNDGSVVCRLMLRLDGEWVVKADVGSLSEQPDGGDRLKAAFSDALKRAAVKFGVGRYLYRLHGQWVDYDPEKKQIMKKPELPDWAIPAAPVNPTVKVWRDWLKANPTLEAFNSKIKELKGMEPRLKQDVWDMMIGHAESVEWAWHDQNKVFVKLDQKAG